MNTSWGNFTRMCGIFIYLTACSYHSRWQRPHINVYGFDADLAVGRSVSRGFQVTRPSTARLITVAAHLSNKVNAVKATRQPAPVVTRGYPFKRLTMLPSHAPAQKWDEDVLLVM